MLILGNTTSTITVTTSAAGAISVHADVADTAPGSTTITPSAVNSLITTATTATVVPAPSGGANATVRNVQTLAVRNTSATVANLVTVTHADTSQSQQTAVLFAATLQPGESMVLGSDGQPTPYDVNGSRKITQAAPASAYPQTRQISSGTTDAGPSAMSGGNCLALWNSATAGAKTQTAPTAAGTGNRFTVIDLAGTANVSPITFVPAAGSVTGNNQVYSKNGAQTWVDTALGWAAEV